jgi:hypothetical protein
MNKGKLRVEKDDENSPFDLFICDGCWRLLKNPATAIPLIRGDLSISLRDNKMKSHIDNFISKLMELKNNIKS